MRPIYNSSSIITDIEFKTLNKDLNGYLYSNELHFSKNNKTHYITKHKGQFELYEYKSLENESVWKRVKILGKLEDVTNALNEYFEGVK